jgi:hypothetical protein
MLLKLERPRVQIWHVFMSTRFGGHLFSYIKARILVEPPWFLALRFLKSRIRTIHDIFHYRTRNQIPWLELNEQSRTPKPNRLVLVHMKELNLDSPPVEVENSISLNW